MSGRRSEQLRRQAPPESVAVPGCRLLTGQVEVGRHFTDQHRNGVFQLRTLPDQVDQTRLGALELGVAWATARIWAEIPARYWFSVSCRERW